MPLPTILADPEDLLDIRTGSNVTFTISAEGLRLTFAWQRTDNPLLTSNPRFVGADTGSLTVYSVRFSDAGMYLCWVSNGAGSVSSMEAVLTVGRSRV